MSPATVLEVTDLRVGLRRGDGEVPVLDGVSLTVAAGECVAVVGESGAGKTVLALAVVALLPPVMRVVGGGIRVAGTEVVGASDATTRALRGGAVGMVFQDPQASLHPAFRVGAQVAEAIRAHRPEVGRAGARAEAAERLRRVGITDPRAFPHQLSGGMRQRVMLAMATANDPPLCIADEATSALDVTVQAQVLDLLASTRAATGAGLLLVTHDLGVVATVADRVVVLYAGRVVESGPAAEVLAAPRHPYTQGLAAAVPRLDRVAPVAPIPGQPPDPWDRPSGCAFRSRCPRADARCADEVPVLGAEAPGLAAVACHHPGPSA